MILLDTNAVIWLGCAHRRARPLDRFAGRLILSPVVVFELQFVLERVRRTMWRGATLDAVRADPRWTLDDPPSAALFDAACDVSWTADPFDRLIVGHAMSRSFRLATADARILEHMPKSAVLEL